jgi:hypothetical protein
MLYFCGMKENGNESLTDGAGWHQEEGITGEDTVKPLATKGLLFDPMQVNSFFHKK